METKSMQLALSRSTGNIDGLHEKLDGILVRLNDLDTKLRGKASKNKVGEKTNPTAYSRLSFLRSAAWNTYGPTSTHISSFEIAEKEHSKVKSALLPIIKEEIPALKEALKKAGAPYMQGEELPE